MLTKTNDYIRIPRDEWNKLKKNPSFNEFIELLEDEFDLQKAKKVKGKDLSIDEYLKKRGLQINS